MAKYDLASFVGTAHHRLEILELITIRKNGVSYKHFVCKCNCENETIKSIYAYDIIHNKTQSCGCLHREIVIAHETTHGLTNTRLFRIWHDMVRRCTKPNRKTSKRYYLRGITVCNEWRNSFQAFYDWAIASGYNEHVAKHGKRNTTIDRYPNKDGNYKPTNCRWATMKEQIRNQGIRSTNKTGCAGVSIIDPSPKFPFIRFRVTIRNNGKQEHIGIYNTLEEAVAARKLAEKKYWNKE